MRSPFVLLAALLVAPPVAAADPVADLLRLAPKDAPFALVVRDLKGTVKRLDESPFAAWFPTTKFGKSLAQSADWKKLLVADAALLAALGVSGETLVNDVFGDAVVYAYQPPPKDKPEDDAGLLLLKARDADKLAAVIGKFNEVQQMSGEVKAVRELKHGGKKYFARDRNDGRGEFYWTDGATLAFSANESAVKAAIDRAAAPGPAPLADALDKLELKSAAVVAVFQPRTLDTELKAAVADAKEPNQAAFLKQFQKVWGACDAVAVSLEIGTDVSLSVSVAANQEKVPAELKPLFGPGTPTELWSVIPPDALFAVAGKLDLPALLDAVKSFLTDDGKAGLKALFDDKLGPVVGKDKLPALVKGIGPDVAFWVTAPPKGGKAWAPTATVAVKADDKTGPRLLDALDLFAQLIRIEYNRTHDDQIDFQTDDGVKVLVNDALFPAGVRPAYALRHGYLILSSSDAGVKAFAAPKAAPGDAAGRIARVSLAKLGEYLAAHGPAVSTAMAKLTGAKPDDVTKQLAGFGELLELFDSVELKRSGKDGSIRLSLTVKPAKPLAK